MAVIPICWPFNNDYASNKRELYDYPAVKDLGTASGTSYFLKIQFKPSISQRKDDRCKILSVKLERFRDLKSESVHGSISVYLRTTFNKMGWKAFEHSFKDGEKLFSFEILIDGDIDSNVGIHGHIVLNPRRTLDESCPAPEIHRAFGQLSQDYLQLLNDEKRFSDITLDCQGVKIPAHRNILSARSLVFKAMLEKNMKEALTGVIKIKDIRPDTVKAMLKYIYCGKVDDLSEKTACDLLYAADKYQLLELKDICVSHLKSKINHVNVFKILDVAVLHDDRLKSIAIEYIGENFTVIEKSAGWAFLKTEKPSLVMDILTKIVKFGK